MSRKTMMRKHRSYTYGACDAEMGKPSNPPESYIFGKVNPREAYELGYAERKQEMKDEAARAKEQETDAWFLRDLAERLMGVPVMYGTDQGDVDRLNEIAGRI